MKAFCMTEGEKYGLTPHGIWTRIKRGWYRNLIEWRYTNARVIFVRRISDADPVSPAKTFQVEAEPEFADLFNRRNKIT